jgi:hypothetical protein
LFDKYIKQSIWMGSVDLSKAFRCSLYCLSVSERSELVINLEAKAVGAGLVLELGAVVVLVGGDGPVVVDLVLDLGLNLLVLANAHGSLQVGAIRELKFSSEVGRDGVALETLSTIGGAVAHFMSGSNCGAPFSDVSNAHKVLLEVSTQEAGVVALGGEAELGPESLEVLGVMLEVDADVVFAFVGDVGALLVENFRLLVVLNMVL